MKISVITTISNPDARQDAWREALASYLDFSDEVIIVNGGDPVEYPKSPKLQPYFLDWPKEWDWSELPAHLNLGLEKATGDWVLKMDIDQVIHEATMADLRAILESLSEFPVATMEKCSFVTAKWCYLKGKIPVLINKGRFPEVRFGEADDKATDLCYPIFARGEILKQGTRRMVARGPAVPESRYGHTGIPYYNYDYTFKIKEVTRSEFFRFSRAYARYFGDWTWGRTEEEAFQFFLQMMRSRFKKCQSLGEFPIENHPRYIREKVASVKPEQFGFDGWGLLLN